MKVTKEQLKQFIKQEYQSVIGEGDEHSRTITQIEKIGDEIIRTVKMVNDPAVSERLMMIDNMITDLVAKMQSVEPAPQNKEMSSKEYADFRSR